MVKNLRPRIVLSAVASQYVHSALAPWCLKAGIEQYALTACDIHVVEGTINETAQDVTKRIIAQAPDILGISCYIWNIVFVCDMLPRLRQALPACVILLGGPESTHRAEELLRTCPQIDYILAGEGEKPLAQLVDALHMRKAVEKVPGLCYRCGEAVRTQPAYAHDTMQPSPYCGDYFAQLNGRIAYLETSRGCPFSCAFCLSGCREKVRCVSMERAQCEILLLAGSGTKTVKLVDRTFNANPARARAMFEFVIGEYGRGIPKNVCFHFEIGGDLLDDETLALLSTAPPGLIQMEIGLQSFNAETLFAVNRVTDITRLIDRLQRLIALQTVRVHIDLIAGLPKEDVKSFARGVDRTFLLFPQTLQLGFLKVLPGSAMREEEQKYPMQYDAAPPYRVRSTPWLTQEELVTLSVVERALDRLYNSGRFTETLKWLTQKTGETPYRLLKKAGDAIILAEKKAGTLSLEALTQVTFDHMIGLYPEHRAQIRDLMLIDRFATTATKLIPLCLQKTDNRLALAKATLNRRGLGQKGCRAVGILYSVETPLLVWADPAERHPVTGRFTTHTEELVNFL